MKTAHMACAVGCPDVVAAGGRDRGDGRSIGAAAARASAVVLTAAVLVMGGGCAGGAKSTTGPSAAVMQPPASAQTAQAMEKLKTLAGKWKGTVNEMKDTPAESVFAVTSAGSLVREIMWPGSEHEMTNTYHLDGPSLVATHYCAGGNQPHMVATIKPATGSEPETIVFKLRSISNYTTDEKGFMGELELRFIDKDHVVQRWTNFKDGRAGGTVTMDLRRVG